MENKKIRVLQMGASNIGVGGRSTIAYQFSIHMDQKKFVNDFLCMGELPAEKYCNEIERYGGKIVHYKKEKSENKLIYNLNRARFFLKEVRLNHYDIAHIHCDSASEFLPRALLCRLSGIRVIIAHGHTSKVDSGFIKFKNFLCQKFMPLVCNYIFGCSNEAIHYLYSGEKLKKEYIPNGVDCEKYKFNQEIRDKIRRKYGWTNKTVIGHVGRFSVEKNHSFIIETFYKLAKINNDAMLLLVGSGDGEKNIHALVKKMGLEEKVIFCGISYEIETLLWAMDLFLLPSLWEGFPIVALEAQAAGLPLCISDKITSDVKITPFVYQYSLDISSMEWAVKINKITQSNHSKVQRINSCFYIHRSKYNLQKSASNIEKIYLELIR